MSCFNVQNKTYNMKNKYTSLTFILLLFTSIICAQTTEETIAILKSKIGNNEFKDALKIANKGIEKDAFNADLYIQRSIINGYLGEFNSARVDSDNAINCAPNTAEPRIQKGNVFYIYKYFNLAIKEFLIADSLATTDSIKILIYSYLSGSYSSIRDFKNAEKQAYLGYNIDSTNLNILSSLSIIYSETNREKLAIKYALKIIEKDSSNPLAYNNLGYFYECDSNYAAALETYNNGLEIFPKHPLLLGNKGHCLYVLGKSLEGLTYINKSIEMFPGNSYSYKTRALIYLALNKPDEACADLSKAIEEGYTGQYGKEARELQLKHCFK